MEKGGDGNRLNVTLDGTETGNHSNSNGSHKNSVNGNGEHFHREEHHINQKVGICFELGNTEDVELADSRICRACLASML